MRLGSLEAGGHNVSKVHLQNKVAATIYTKKYYLLIIANLTTSNVHIEHLAFWFPTKTNEVNR